MKTKFNILTIGIFLAVVSKGLCQPVITNQPQSQTNLAGTTATFSVASTSTSASSHQWQRDVSDLNFYALVGRTNATLLITNVSLNWLNTVWSLPIWMVPLRVPSPTCTF